ncbi:U3 snoRNP protein [Modicella reniformis]|uniref:U3 small nucleolar RNA-associated protein 18 homolog n=1 Tax=Modicella reniformis TaxID=1440133 RepID=A0A9P6J1G3_9FUNG|nr:U3 snoRNP protein [Modicella reniformis]
MTPKTKKPKVVASSNVLKKQATLQQAKRVQADVRPITHISEPRSNNKRGSNNASKDSKRHINNNNVSNDSEPIRLKEKSEIELENLVFGDNEDLVGETFSKIGHELSSDEEIDERDEFDYDTEEDNMNSLDKGSNELGDDGSDLFFMDTGPSPLPKEAKEELEEEMSENDGKKSEESRLIAIYGGKPAWVDADDKTLSISLKAVNRLKKLRKEESEDVINGVDYEQRLRKQFQKVYPIPNWVEPEESKKRRRRTTGADSDSDFSDVEEQQQEDHSLLKSSKGYLEKSTKLRILSPESILVTRVKNANQMGYSKAVVQSVEFHPNSQMLLTAGFDRTLRLFQIDGKLNQLMQSIFYKDMPIYKAAFSANGNAIVASGRRKYFYTYDIEAGKVEKSQGIYGRREKSLEKFSLSPCGKWTAFLGRDGYIILVSNQTKQWIKNLKMNGNVRSVAWSSDGMYLYSVGGDTEIYQWEISSGKCLHRFMDEGGFKPTCVAVSPNNQYWAVGSRSGIVNVYDRSCLSTHKPKSLRAIGNLTTSIHTMRFNHDSQILAISSKSRKDQLKLVHIPSLKVFPNWPTSGTPLSYVTSLTFSPKSGYLAVGNDRGKVLLYRLNHYSSA